MDQQRRPYLIAAMAIVALALLLGLLAYRLGRGLGAQVAVATARPTFGPAAIATPPAPPSPTATPLPAATATPSPTATPTAVPSPTPTAIITALPPIPQGFLVTVNQPVQIVKSYDSAPAWWPRFPPFNLVAGRFTIVAYSDVAAGIDFARVRPSDVVRVGDAVTITLPAPELYGRPTIDPGQSYIVEQPGLSPKDLNQVLAAQNDLQGAVEAWALSHDILMTARDTGQQLVELWFRRLGFRDVTVRWDYTRPPG